MHYIYEERINIGTEDEDVYTKTFKTLAGATNHGCKRLKSYGYSAADRIEGNPTDPPWMKRHVRAEWKRNRVPDLNGRLRDNVVVARVYT